MGSKDNLEDHEIKQIISLFPDCLSEREKQVIDMRYGESKKTLQQIGDMFGVTRERIRQIVRKALRKLRHPSRLKAYRFLVAL